MNDRIEQIGRSGMKHAFLTLNNGCNNCGSSYILWPQCQDTYSSGNNDSNYYLGPRVELEASTGIWEESPSFFDPNNTGNHQNSSTSWENRLVVNESELGLAGAEYIFDSWYLVRDDINIFNTMGYRVVDLNFTGSTWQVTHVSNTTILGSVMDTWLTGGVNEETVEIDDPKGHLRIDIKVSNLGQGDYHYEYALSNFDYDPQIKSFKVTLPDGLTAENVGFSGPQGYFNTNTYKYEAASWDITQNGSELIFSASDTTHWLDWGGLYNLYFDIAAEPISGTLEMEKGEESGMFSPTILVPSTSVGSDVIFASGFE
jgi:hypothetical protein